MPQMPHAGANAGGGAACARAHVASVGNTTPRGSRKSSVQPLLAFNTRTPPRTPVGAQNSHSPSHAAWMPSQRVSHAAFAKRLTVRQAIVQKSMSDRGHHGTHDAHEQNRYEASINMSTQNQLLRRSMGRMKEKLELEFEQNQQNLALEHKVKLRLMAMRHKKEMDDLRRALATEMGRPLKYSKKLLEAVDCENQLAAHNKIEEWKHVHRRVSKMKKKEDERGHLLKVAAFDDRVFKLEAQQERERESMEESHVHTTHLWRNRREVAARQLHRRHQNSHHDVRQAHATATRDARIARGTFFLRTELAPLDYNPEGQGARAGSKVESTRTPGSASTSRAAMCSFATSMAGDRTSRASMSSPRRAVNSNASMSRPMSSRMSLANFKGHLMMSEAEDLQLPEPPRLDKMSVLAAQDYEHGLSKERRDWLTTPRPTAAANLWARAGQKAHATKAIGIATRH